MPGITGIHVDTLNGKCPIVYTWFSLGIEIVRSTPEHLKAEAGHGKG
jgi:hypothetical protein